MIREKIFYHSLNIACQNNFNLLSKLKKHFSSFELAWKSNSYERIENFRETTWDSFLKKKKNIDPKKEWQKIEEENIYLILFEEDLYPPLLKEISQSPLGLYLKGKLNPEKPKIAIVGTRHCTSYGQKATQKITSELKYSPLIIVSGLAEGIDTFSHLTALENNQETIAVLGSGFNHIFPKSNIDLAKRISQKGCLISEYHPDTLPAPYQFPARNRIVSGLSLATVVVEAPKRSGALITASMALEENREVMAVPGDIFSSKSEGTNSIIKQGAKAVSSAKDILLELNLI